MVAPGHLFKEKPHIPFICILKAPRNGEMEKWAEPSNRRSCLTGIVRFLGLAFRDVAANIPNLAFSGCLELTTRSLPALGNSEETSSILLCIHDANVALLG